MAQTQIVSDWAFDDANQKLAEGRIAELRDLRDSYARLAASEVVAGNSERALAWSRRTEYVSVLLKAWLDEQEKRVLRRPLEVTESLMERDL